MDNITHGTFTLTGAAESITGLPAGADGGVILKALKTNAADVFVGSTGVTKAGSATDGVPLAAGESIPIDIYNPADLKVIGTAGDKIAWMSLTS